MPLIDGAGRHGLARFSLGLVLRILVLAVGVPVAGWLLHINHPVGVWVQRVVWLVVPISGALLSTGASSFGARSAGLGLSMATAADAYAALMGFYGSVASMEQVPFALAIANVLALVGLISMMATVRATAGDADAPVLARRSARASVHLVITLLCTLAVWSLALTRTFEGLPLMIIAGVVLMFAIVALLHSVSVVESTRTLEEEKEPQHEH